MKTLTILAFVVLYAISGCKSKCQPLKTDTAMMPIDIGYVMKDGTGHIVDSVLNNDQYLIYNYKKVPMGVYKTEVIDTTSEASSGITGAVFINRKLIYRITVIQPLTHYGDKRIWHFTNKD